MRKEVDGAVHIGPTAEDFYAVFDLDSNPKTIATVDADGISLAVLLAVNRKIMSQEQERVRQVEQINNIQYRLDQLQSANRLLKLACSLLLSLNLLLGLVCHTLRFQRGWQEVIRGRAIYDHGSP